MVAFSVAAVDPRRCRRALPSPAPAPPTPPPTPAVPAPLRPALPPSLTFLATGTLSRPCLWPLRPAHLHTRPASPRPASPRLTPLFTLLLPQAVFRPTPLALRLSSQHTLASLYVCIPARHACLFHSPCFACSAQNFSASLREPVFLQAGAGAMHDARPAAAKVPPAGRHEIQTA